MYLSHPVRRMRENPQEGETVTLVVELSDTQEAEASAVGDAIEGIGGSVEKELPFGSLQVTLQQTAIEDLCSVEGISALKTANTIGYAGDAGEDV